MHGTHSVLFMLTEITPISASCISETIQPISTKFIYHVLYIRMYTPPLIQNLKEIVQSIHKIFVLKYCLISLYFTSSSLHQKINFESHKSTVLVLRFPSNLVHI